MNAVGDGGIDLNAPNSPVRIYAGQASTEGGANVSDNPEGSPAAQQIAIDIKTPKAIGLNGSALLIDAPTTNIKAKTIVKEASDSIKMVSQGGTALVSKTYDLMLTGNCAESRGGPQDMLPTNGACHVINYTAIGPPMAQVKRSFLLGGQADAFNLGAWATSIKVGGRSISTFDPVPVATVGIGTGFSGSAGPSALNNGVQATLAGAMLNSKIPGTVASVTSIAGPASLTGGISAAITGAAIATIASPFVKVNAPGLPGGVLTDGCIDGLTGMPLLAGGTMGCPGFRL